ncbi:outer membrane protein OmpA-like peptidoglycan-associated protein [Flavobacterium cauense R2A-7]|uniref:Outer membrane protein OmpA-like peptidoglycan-associated protein n=1 Tax=Flavobacterium cauense R2A-7 TaxID=1341154 RepID=A0A562M467_9FLAO|nr:OmpA family protein [Flavobacterium cauense]TWI14622.1 outer membrane protein OmpA-like peptidoglycan-associated protein [Flavobacterium cauense R2A-7]
MNKNYFSLLLCLLTFPLFSQKVVFHDTFEDDRNQWALSNNNLTTYIKKGRLVMENNDPQNSKWELMSVVSAPDAIDFDVEATLTLEKTPSETATYGLVWSCYNDYSDYRVVQLSANKQVQLYNYFNKEFHYNKKWETSNYVFGKGKDNKIKVVKRANIIKVYVNDGLVYQNGGNSYYGSKVGFILDAGVTLAIDELKVTEYPLGIKVVPSYNPNLKMDKLPETISSADYEEVNPVVSADGNTLYYDRKDCPMNIEGNKDDIWFSTKDAAGNWTASKNMGRPLNNRDYNFVISSSPDNNTLLLGNKYAADGVSPNGAGVSIAKRTVNGWEIPKDVVIEDYINTNEYVGYFLSADNKHLLLSVERPEGLGLKDLYVSFLKEDNTWSKPKSLGNVVNTFEEEMNPFLASDGKTLYFSSKGHCGYGDADLFVSKRLDDTWTNWSVPENLGNVINSVGAELGIFLSAKGDKAYVSRTRDIYEIINTVKQDPVVLVKGKVFDSKTKKTIGAQIEYNNLKTNKNLGTAISNPADGSYSIVLPYGELYSFMGNKEGYYAVSQNVDLTKLNEYKEMEVDLYLTPIEKGEVIRLNNIFFNSGKYELLAESYAELNKLHAILQGNQKIKIEIAGHTDAVGSDVDNMTLSKNRANSVQQYLISKGISADRITSKGYGETKFIATNETEAGKQQNRRVEFIVLDL